MKLHEKISNIIEEEIITFPETYVGKDLSDIEVRHTLIDTALDNFPGKPKNDELLEEVIDTLDFVMEHYGSWDRLANIVMCVAQDVEEPTYHVEDHRRDVL